jgi:hypothetical protein
MLKKIWIGLFIIIIGVIDMKAQEPTTRKNTAETKELVKTKILIIPFENKMYMSEIDYYINKETNLTQKQIRYEFRDGLNEQLFHAFKKRKFQPIDLMSDTVKYSKELKYIYNNITYDYVPIPDQNNYKPPVKPKKEKGIQQGQIVADSDDENKFMNTRVLNPSLVPYLYQKFKADYYLFINELDLKASVVNPTDFIPETAKRKIVVHYTCFSVDAKEINSGIAEIEAETKVNVPGKIIKNYFSVIAETIADRVLKQIAIQSNTKKQ